jgi:hypothetical protein
MSKDESIENDRRAFFERVRKAIQDRGRPIVCESELEVLWSGPNGRFDQEKVHQAFQREGLHLDSFNLV